MPSCKFCNEQNLEWFQDSQDKWHLGIKLDINNYRVHICTPKKEESNNKRNWIKFNCVKCGQEVRRNIKLHKSLNLSIKLNNCIECSNL